MPLNNDASPCILGGDTSHGCEQRNSICDDIGETHHDDVWNDEIQLDDDEDNKLSKQWDVVIKTRMSYTTAIISAVEDILIVSNAHQYPTMVPAINRKDEGDECLCPASTRGQAELMLMLLLLIIMILHHQW